ncbi:MAG: hypothetical protein WDN44_05015 [Sphingomonas sp.]
MAGGVHGGRRARLLLAVLVATLREPMRGQSEGLRAPPHPAPLRGFLEELLTILPPLTLIGAAQGGVAALSRNLAVLLVLAGAVYGLITLGEPPAQWIAVAVGVYAVYSWGSALRRRDPPAYALILGTPAFLCVVLAYGLNAFLAYAVAWAAPTFAETVFHVTKAEAGLWIGGPAILAGFLGVTLGGIAADRLRRTSPSGRIAVILFAVTAVVPMIVAFTTHDKWVYFAMLPLAQFLCSTALGSAAAATQDLVLPRMRGAATAAFFIGTHADRPRARPLSRRPHHRSAP